MTQRWNRLDEQKEYVTVIMDFFMIIKIRSIATLTICLLFVFSINTIAYAEGDQEQLLGQRYEWVLEEILQQVTELRKEVISMKEEVAALNVKFDALPKGAVQGGKDALTKVELGGNILGDEDASYAIVEFSDFQCPYCSRHAESVFPQIKKELIDTGKIRYTVRDYPLGFHKEAKGAAIAANCAGEQDRYWDMHEVLFANQRKLKNDFYIETAQSLNLEQDKFTQCLENPAKSKAVDQDIAYGNSLGVTGTPKFFVGRIKDNTIIDIQVISGAQNYDAFSGAIERLNNTGS